MVTRGSYSTMDTPLLRVVHGDSSQSRILQSQRIIALSECRPLFGLKPLSSGEPSWFSVKSKTHNSVETCSLVRCLDEIH